MDKYSRLERVTISPKSCAFLELAKTTAFRKSILDIWPYIVFFLVLGLPADATTSLDGKLFDEASSQVFKVGVATSIDAELKGHGTGFVVSEDGLVATAFHVVADALDLTSSEKYRSKIYVVRKGVRVEASIWAVDSMHDMAIIKVPTTFSQPWSLSTKVLEKGASVFLMGFPGQADFAIVNGILQSKELSEVIPTYQITAPGKEGMSGGPVLSSKGEVIGMILAGVGGKGDITLAGQGEALGDLISMAVKRNQAPDLGDLIEEAHRGQLELQAAETKLLKKIFQTRTPFNGWYLPSTKLEKSDILCGESSAEPHDADFKLVPQRFCQFKMATDGEEVSFSLSYNAIPVRSNQFKTASLAAWSLNEGRKWKRDRKKFGKFSCEPDVHLKKSDGTALLVSVCSRISGPSMDVFHSVVRVASLDLKKPGMVGKLNLVGFTKNSTKQIVGLFIKSLEVDHEFEPEE